MLKLCVSFFWATWLVLHPKCPPPSGNKILSGFLRAMLASFGGGERTATLCLRWCHLGVNFANFWIVLKATCDHFGPCCFGIVKNKPKTDLRNAPPPFGPEGEVGSNQKPPQETIKTPACRAVKAKRNQTYPQTSQNVLRGPAATTSCALGVTKPPIAEVYWDDDVFASFLRKWPPRRQVEFWGADVLFLAFSMTFFRFHETLFSWCLILVGYRHFLRMAPKWLLRA